LLFPHLLLEIEMWKKDRDEMSDEMLARDGCCQKLDERWCLFFRRKKDGCYAKTLDGRLQMPLGLPIIGVGSAWKSRFV
jgi:hypothetical protein